MRPVIKITSEVVGGRIVSVAGWFAFHKTCATCGKHKWFGLWARQIDYTDYTDGSQTKEVRYYCETGCEWKREVN